MDIKIDKLYLCHTSIFFGIFLGHNISQYSIYKDLHLESVVSDNVLEIFSKKHIDLIKDEINTFDDFYLYVKSRYQKHKVYLSRIWQVGPEKKLIAIFFMNTVSSLWAYGNKNLTKKPGCVSINEDNDFKEVKNPTIKTYINSKIGCCTDYAFLLAFLLEKEKISNRKVSVQGHIFNEVLINGSWYVLDANTNLMFESSWQEIIHRKPNQIVKVKLFPHCNLINNGDDFYRPIVGKFILEMIYWALSRSAFVKKYI